MNEISFVKNGHSVYPLVDTHCHLDILSQMPLIEILKKSFNVGVEKIITIATEVNNLQDVLELSRKEEKIYCTQGIHPHNANEWSKKAEDLIRENLSENKVIAVGEIGLDYHYEHSPQDVQKKVFEKQLQLATTAGLPVVIHSRNADDDMIAMLKNIPSLRGVLHSYTGGEKLAQTALNNGLYLGFNGIITFKKASNVRRVLQDTPPERILLETDAPFLTPEPHRGGENACFYLPFIAERLLQIKEISAEDALPVIFNNSLELFNLQ
ncbi:MAG: TatD family hydrolase [Halobacteriovoraceae bacterium]|nr:TatD family hydrolase [Halobacteriovoraceae bacterium]